MQALLSLPDETFELLARLQSLDDLNVMNFEPTISNAPASISPNQVIMKDATIKQVPGCADIRLADMRREKICSGLSRISIDLYNGKTEHVLPPMEAPAHEAGTPLASAHDLGKSLVGAFLSEMRTGLCVVKDGIWGEDVRPSLLGSGLETLVIILSSRITR
jgi:hypothetical protein